MNMTNWPPDLWTEDTNHLCRSFLAVLCRFHGCYDWFQAADRQSYHDVRHAKPSSKVPGSSPSGNSAACFWFIKQLTDYPCSHKNVYASLNTVWINLIFNIIIRWWSREQCKSPCWCSGHYLAEHFRYVTRFLCPSNNNVCSNIPAHGRDMMISLSIPYTENR